MARRCGASPARGGVRIHAPPFRRGSVGKRPWRPSLRAVHPGRVPPSFPRFRSAVACPTRRAAPAHPCAFPGRAIPRGLKRALSCARPPFWRPLLRFAPGSAEYRAFFRIPPISPAPQGAAARARRGPEYKPTPPAEETFFTAGLKNSPTQAFCNRILLLTTSEIRTSRSFQCLIISVMSPCFTLCPLFCNSTPGIPRSIHNSTVFSRFLGITYHKMWKTPPIFP